MKNQLIVLFFGVCLLSTTSYSPTSSAATGETTFAPLIGRPDPRLNQIR